jgi:hypothetical protein
MGRNRVPEQVAVVIRRCWPSGEVAEFDTSESYFQGIHERLERDLRNIPGASLMWQTEPEGRGDSRDDDWEDEPPPSGDFQSYHVFFLAPRGGEFQFETETESVEEPEDPEDDALTSATYRGKGWTGCVVGICLAARIGALTLGDYAEFEDGSTTTPDPGTADATEYYRKTLDENAFRKLETLRQNIAAVLKKHRIRLLEESILNLPVPELQATEDLFLEQPLRVRDAFFFRGV